MEFKPKKNIYFANLIQNTKELKLNIPWKKFGSLKDPLLYAKADINQFVLLADLSCLQKGGVLIPMYGFSCTIKPTTIQVLPGVHEENEVIFDGGFYENQKEGLRWYLRLKEVLKGFKV